MSKGTDPEPPRGARSAPLRIVRRLLSSPVVWRLSGATYPSAVLATHGRYVSREAYLRNCAAQVESITAEISEGDRAVELGCGLGGNLIALAPRLAFGLGLDVNALYLRHARRLAASHHAANLHFRTVSAIGEFLEASAFDVALSIGVFERIPPAIVKAHVTSLAAHVRPGGRLILYFLSTDARDSPLVDRLGPEAYVFWSESEARRLVAAIPSLSVRDCRRWYGLESRSGPAPAFLVIADRGRSSGTSSPAFPPPNAEGAVIAPPVPAAR